MKASSGLAVLASVFAIALALGAPPPARAATITANGTTCTLAHAINTANTDKNTGGCVRVGTGTVDTIELTSDVTIATKDTTDTDEDDEVGPNGLPPILGHVIVNGQGHTIQRDPALFAPPDGDGVDPCSGSGEQFRLLWTYYPGGDLTVNDATLKNGCAAGFGGGAIYHVGHVLNLNRVTLANNAASVGGAIFVFQSSTSKVADSRLTGNSALAGGAIYVNGATMAVTNSTLDGNAATGSPGNVCVNTITTAVCFARASGGAFALGGGTTNVVNSTLTRNTAANGGVINNAGATAVVTNATLRQNAATKGAVVFSAAGSTRLIHSTAVENSATAGGGIFLATKLRTATVSSTLLGNPIGGNCGLGAGGPGILSTGYNISTDGSCALTGTHDRQNIADLRLAGYADDGGPGNGHYPLLPGSPAIDAGTADGQSADQLGELRMGVPDIGAIEYPRSVKVWIGVKGAADIGLRVDLLAETFVNGTPSGQAQLTNLATGKNGFANTILYTIPIPVLDVPSGTPLAVKLSARRSCSGAGPNTGTARLWYGGQPVDIPPGQDAGSRIGATAADRTGYLFLRENFALDATPGPGAPSNLFLDALVNSAVACPGAGRPFTAFGTWSVTVP